MKLGVGLDVVAVPYKGSAPALQALLSNEVPVIIDTLAGMSGLIDDGKVRALAALTDAPPVNHEKLPTIAAAGFDGYAADTWNGFMVPGGTPKDIVALLHKEIVAILALPDVKAKILAIGLEPDEHAHAIHRGLRQGHRHLDQAGRRRQAQVRVTPAVI